jgi:hypothetical protein
MLPHCGHLTLGFGIPVATSSEMNPPHQGHLLVIRFTSDQTCVGVAGPKKGKRESCRKETITY